MTTIKSKNSDHIIKIDEWNKDRLSKFDWYVSIKGDCVYRRLSSKSLRELNPKKYRYTVPIANEIMQRFDTMFDHRNRNPFENLESNLRPCSSSQNNANKAKESGCSSIYKGVSFYKPRRVWSAQICKDKKSRWLGYFKNQKEAAKAYNDSAIRLFGEFAVLNDLTSSPLQSR